LPFDNFASLPAPPRRNALGTARGGPPHLGKNTKTPVPSRWAGGVLPAGSRRSPSSGRVRWPWSSSTKSAPTSPRSLQAVFPGCGKSGRRPRPRCFPAVEVSWNGENDPRAGSPPYLSLGESFPLMKRAATTGPARPRLRPSRQKIASRGKTRRKSQFRAALAPAQGGGPPPLRAFAPLQRGGNPRPCRSPSGEVWDYAERRPSTARYS